MTVHSNNNQLKKGKKSPKMTQSPKNNHQNKQKTPIFFKKKLKGVKYDFLLKFEKSSAKTLKNTNEKRKKTRFFADLGCYEQSLWVVYEFWRQIFFGQKTRKMV